MNLPGKPTGKSLEFSRENFEILQEKVGQQNILIEELKMNRDLRIKIDQIQKQIIVVLKGINNE